MYGEKKHYKPMVSKIELNHERVKEVWDLKIRQTTGGTFQF